MMSYTSLQYLILILILLVFYYAVPLHRRYLILLAGSMIFYYSVSGGNLLLILFFLLTILFAFVMGKQIDASEEKKKKTLMILGWCILLVPLLAGRGRDFLLHGAWNSWILPVGISFYTMQLCAYLSDIYTGKIQAERNLLHFALFSSFFPQIIQGPIPRYRQLSEQLSEGHAFDKDAFSDGLELIVRGLFLKFMIAEHAAPAVAAVFENSELYTAPYVLAAGILYSIQLYTDFLSCTRLSQGVSLLFGIRLAENFNHPYTSYSIRDFWGRWHMSFSSWLKDYVYIPLGGNRKGKARQYINLVITFLVSGIWHGGALQYIAWGLYHAFCQIFERLFHVQEQSGFRRILQVIRTDLLVMLGWILFRAQGLSTGLRMWRDLLKPSSFSLGSMNLDMQDYSVLSISLLVFIIFEKRSGNTGKTENQKLRWSLCMISLICIWIFGAYGYGFDAQSFIYGGF